MLVDRDQHELIGFVLRCSEMTEKQKRRILKTATWIVCTLTEIAVLISCCFEHEVSWGFKLFDITPSSEDSDEEDEYEA